MLGSGIWAKAFIHRWRDSRTLSIGPLRNEFRFVLIGDAATDRSAFGSNLLAVKIDEGGIHNIKESV